VVTVQIVCLLVGAAFVVYAVVPAEWLKMRRD